LGIFARIESLNEFRFDYSLERIKLVLDRLGRPQDSFGVIHVAGSNGKGSTCAYIEAALRANGFNTGIYSSPHISSVKERILVSGRQVPDTLWEKLGNELWDEIRLQRTFLTYFEFLTALMFMIFRELKVQLAVIEAGLGGRYDATNVDYKHKLLSIITSISLEHTALLGRTTIKILKEKEQIVPSGGLGLFNLKEKALVAHVKKEFGGRAVFPSDFYAVKKQGVGEHVIKEAGGGEFSVITAMPEPVQAENMALALSALRIIMAFGYKTIQKTNLKGMARVSLPGRLGKISKGVYASVAHNSEAIEKLVAGLKAIFAGSPLVMVFTALKDKDIGAMLGAMKKYRQLSLIITEIKNERAEKAEVIASIAKKLGIMHRVEKDPKEALVLARSYKAKAVIICGSFYLLGALNSQKAR